MQDVVLAAIYHAYIEETAGGVDFSIKPKRDDKKIEEYLLRERIYALAQGLLVEEKDDDVAEGCGEGGS